MNRRFLFILFSLFAAFVIWSFGPGELQVPKTGPDLIAVSPARPSPANRETNPSVTVESPITPASANSADPTLTADREKDAFLQRAEVLERAETQPDDQGNFTRKRLLKTTAKYPLLRVEENWNLDPATGMESRQNQVIMVADHFLTEPLPDADLARLIGFVRAAGGSLRRQLPNSQVFLISIPSASLEDYETMSRTLSGQGTPFRFVEPDYLVFPTAIPGDPSFSKLWGLNNIGQTGGTGDADIDAVEAWEASLGSPSVVVGVIDTGVDHTHPDLAANMWKNTGEIPGNNVDDDNNGYVDDTVGWDFVSNDKDPMDDHYHGTHCAGTIGAVGNNGIGVIGVCPVVRIMALKFMAPEGGGTTSDAIEAINYATKNGATLTSNSWGGGGYSQALKDAIDAAMARGQLFVAAAGNDGKNNDLYSSYPASYASANIISVAATDHNDTLASFSNYGFSSVDLAAPGVDIYSTSPGGGYRSLNGTSMACPHVAGACALLISSSPSLNWSQVKAALLGTVDKFPQLSGKVAQGGRLNLGRALIARDAPYISLAHVFLGDSVGYGGVGNGDQIMNPGETISLVVTLENDGPVTASNLQSKLEVLGADGFVTFTKNTHFWGNLAPKAKISNQLSPFKFSLSPGLSTPRTLTLRITSVDSVGRVSVSTSEHAIVSRSTVTGKVVALGGTGLANAKVEYTGPFSGTAYTSADGTYTLNLTDGTYLVKASATGQVPSAPISVTVPPAKVLPDFVLGRSQIQVLPGSLVSNQAEEEVKQHSFNVSNLGNVPLTVNLSASHLSSTPTIQSASLKDLPWEEGFEAESLEGWTVDGNTGLRETTTAIAAAGARSLHLTNTGDNAHARGIHLDFASGSRPQYASFWISAGSGDKSCGNFVLKSKNLDVINFYAKENGRFSVNLASGGDESFAFTPLAWYHVEFRNMDWSAKNFDYYVNGTLIKANINFRNPVSAKDVTQLYLYNFSQDSEAWWDNIRVLKDSGFWMSYTPGKLTLAPGETSAVAVSLSGRDLIAGTYEGALIFATNDPVNPTTRIPVTMNLAGVPNTAPVATSQTVTTPEDVPVVITLQGTDAENNPLTAKITQLPAKGTLYQTLDGVTLAEVIASAPSLVFHPQRKVIYVPAPNENGTAYASFKFSLNDKRSQSAEATVTTNVTAVNDAPTATLDFATGLAGQTITGITTLGNDSDPEGGTLSVTDFTQGVRGVVTHQGGGVFSYAPNAGFTQGDDFFTYTVSDGTGGTAVGTVNISIGYLAGGTWNTPGRDAARSGYYPASLSGQTFAANWTYQFTRSVNQVSIAEGKASTSSLDTSYGTFVAALDLASGTISWRRDLASAYAVSATTYHKGNLYYERCSPGTGNSVAESLAAASGAVAWSSPFDSFANETAPAVSDASVFHSGITGGGLYGVNRSTGARLFAKTFSNYSSMSPTLDTAGNPYLCVSGKLKKLNPATGVETWTYTINATNSAGTRTCTYDAAAQTILLVGTDALYCINVAPATPVQLWKVPGTFTGFPAVANGKVYAITASSNKVQEFNSTTGALLGEFATTSFNCANQPVVLNDALIAGGPASSGSGRTFLFNLSTRALIQTITEGGTFSVGNRHLILADNKSSTGTLRCYTIQAGNQNPIANNQTATGEEDQNVTLTLAGTDADGDRLGALVTSIPLAGTLFQTVDGVTPGQAITSASLPALVANSERKLIFRPAPDAFGNGYASFKFKVNDGAFSSAEATVTLNITGVNDAPQATNDRVYLQAGDILDPYFPTLNDRDVDGEPLSIVSFTSPLLGSLTQNADGSLRYVPNEGFSKGSDTFQYTLSDAAGTTATASVEIVLTDSLRNDWPAIGGGPDHLGRQVVNAGKGQFVQLWEVSPGVTTKSFALAEDRIFLTLTSTSASVASGFALDAKTGSEIWRLALPATTSIALDPPTYHRGSVFVRHLQDKKLYALNASDGAVLWQAVADDSASKFLAPTVSDLGIFISSDDYWGGLRGYDLATGANRFSLAFEGKTNSVPGLYQNQAYTYAKGIFRCHNPLTGAIAWSLNLGENTSNGGVNAGTMALEDGKAYLTCKVVSALGGGDLVCVDLASQSVAWRVTSGYYGTPSVINGVVYALNLNKISAHEATRGYPVGEFADPQYGGTASAADSIIVTNDLLITNGYGTKVLVFNRATRQLQQQLPINGYLAMARGVLYAAPTNGTVSAYAQTPAGNHAPTSQAAKVEILEEAQVTVQLQGSDSDGDEISLVVTTLPAKGTLFQTSDGFAKGTPILKVPALVTHPAGTLIYQAPLDLTGIAADSFAYKAQDWYGSSPPSNIQFDITPVNDAPVAIPDTVALRPGRIQTGIRPMDNDRDVDGDTLTLVSFTQGASGQVTLSADGSLQYTPNPGFTTGSDSFSYVIRDPVGLEATSTCTILISTTLGREWPTFGGGMDHSGYLPISLGKSSFTSKWTYDAGLAFGALAMADGRIYGQATGPSISPKLVALDAAAGALVWQKDIPGTSTGIGSPSVFGGRVYYQLTSSGGGSTTCVRGDTGQNVWSSTLGISSFIPPVVDSNRLYAGNYNELMGLDLTTGTKTFNFPLSYSNWGQATLHREGLYSFNKGNIRKLNKTTAAVEWSNDIPGNYSPDADRTIACADDMAFYVGETDYLNPFSQELIAVNLVTGTTAWRVKGQFVYTPAVAHQTVYVITGTRIIRDSVKAYDAATGVYLGSYNPPDSQLIGQPIVTNDSLITYSFYFTHIFDLKTRVLRQTIPYGKAVTLAGGTLCICPDAENKIRAYSIPDPLNRPATATPLALETPEDTPASLTLAGTDPDNDALSFVISRLPSQGTLYQTSDGVTPGAAITVPSTLVTVSPPRVLYVPPKDGNGDHLGDFGYAASDGNALSAEASATIRVTPVNDAPVAFPDIRFVELGQILSPVAEILNDVDADHDPLTLVSFTQPSQGQVVQNDDDTLHYMQAPGAGPGVISFSYTVSDPSGATASSTVTINIVEKIEGNWSTMGNGYDHSGYVPTTLGNTGWVKRWSRSFTGFSLNQVAVSEGKVFVSGVAALPFATALAEKSGEIVWSKNFAPANSMGPPSYSAGRILLQRGAHEAGTQLHSLSATDGLTLWSTSFYNQWETFLAPAVTPTSVYINGDTSGGLLGLNRATGAKNFLKSLGSGSKWTPALTATELFTFTDGTFASHNPTSGALVWSLPIGTALSYETLNRTVAVSARRACLVNHGLTVVTGTSELVCLNLDTRLVAWRVSGGFYGTPAIVNNTVLALAGNTIQARDVNDGHLLATYTAAIGGNLTGQPIVTDDLVIGQSGLKTYVFGRYDQQLVHTINQGGQMSVADDQLIIAGSDGIVSAYAAQPAVTFSPHGGTFAEPVNITLSAAEPEGRIHYTLDGSAPTFYSPSVASGSTVRMEWTGRVRAILIRGSAISRINEVTVTMLDSDGDNVPDWWENTRFGTLSLVTDNSDSDGDGSPDRDEFLAGTNPNDPNDFFHLTEARLTPADPSTVTLSWPSKKGNLYIVEKSTDMVNWQAVYPPIPGTDGSLSRSPPIETQSRAFYRVKVTPALEEIAP